VGEGFGEKGFVFLVLVGIRERDGSEEEEESYARNAVG